MEKKLESLEMHSLNKNLIFYNITEKTDANLHLEMQNSSILKIPDTFLFSKQNPCAEVRLDMVHCIGQRGTRPRPVVASFTTQQGMCMVKSYSKQLNSTPFSMSEQLLSSVHERKIAQIPQMVKVHNEAQSKNIPATIKLVKDKLIVNNKLKSIKTYLNQIQ